MTSDPPKPPGQPPAEPDPDDPPPIEEPPIPIPVPPIEPPPEPLRAGLRQLLRSQSRGLCRARSILLVEQSPPTQSRPPLELVDGKPRAMAPSSPVAAAQPDAVRWARGRWARLRRHGGEIEMIFITGSFRGVRPDRRVHFLAPPWCTTPASNWSPRH